MTQCQTTSWRGGVLALVAFLSLVLVPALPARAYAPRPGQPVPEPTRAQDLETVRRVLEADMIRDRLTALGLSPQEADQKLNSLSDSQLHRLASKVDALIPGGHIENSTLKTVLLVLAIFLVAIIIVILV